MKLLFYYGLYRAGTSVNQRVEQKLHHQRAITHLADFGVSSELDVTLELIDEQSRQYQFRHFDGLVSFEWGRLIRKSQRFGKNKNETIITDNLSGKSKFFRKPLKV